MNSTSSTSTSEQSRNNKYLSVYGVVDRFFPLPVSAPSSDPIELELSTGGPIAAVYSWVDPGDFDGLEADISEGGRLAKLARRHDGVVRALAGSGTVLPVRLGTLFPDAVSLTELLDQTADDLLVELDRVRGCHEWDVRVHVHQSAADLPITPADESGTAYLMRRRNERQQAVAAQAAISTAISAADEVLTVLAESVVELAIDGSGMAMSRGYLVRTQHAAEFETVAAELTYELEGHGGNVRISGPLPPYSFVKIRLERLSQ